MATDLLNGMGLLGDVPSAWRLRPKESIVTNGAAQQDDQLLANKLSRRVPTPSQRGGE